MMMDIEQQEMTNEEDEEEVCKCLILPKEILESILCYLPICDILSARSVCQSWHVIANQLLINKNLPKLKIQLGLSPSSNAQAFLQISNSIHATPLFAQLCHFIIDGHDYTALHQFEADKPHFTTLFTKYAQQIQALELDNLCEEDVTQFVLDKTNLGKLINLKHLKVSGNITLEFLESPNFDLEGLMKLNSLEFGDAYNLQGQHHLFAKLSKVGKNTELRSVIIGDGGVRWDLAPETLGGLFKNSPHLKVFHHYMSQEVPSIHYTPNHQPVFLIDDPHLIAMTSSTTSGYVTCKLKDLKIMTCGTGDPGIFIQFLSSHATSLESLSLSGLIYFSRDRFWSVDTKFLLLTHLELSSCANFGFLSRIPNLVKLHIADTVDMYLNELEEVHSTVLKSLNLDILRWTHPRIDKSVYIKDYTNIVSKFTACFPNLQDFVVQIMETNKYERDFGKQNVRLGFHLERAQMEKLFANSPAMEQLEYCQLTEADVEYLEEFKSFMEPFVKILISNCNKFMGLDQLGEPIKDVPNQHLVCLLSHGLSYKDMREASSKSLTFNENLGRYGFINLDSSFSVSVGGRGVASFAIGPRHTTDTRTSINKSKFLF